MLPRAAGSKVLRATAAATKSTGHDVEHGVRIAGNGAPQTARVDLERPIHHFEAGGDAGLRVADDDAGAEDDAGQGTEARAHEGFGFSLGLLVGVAIALADGEFVFADQVGAFSGDIGGADVGQAAKLGRGRGKVETRRVPSTLMRRASSSVWSKRTVAAE